MNLNVSRFILKSKIAAIFCLLFLFAVNASAQNVFNVSTETFPTSYNNSATGNQNTTFSGDAGTWGSFSNQSYASVAVINYYYNWSSPNCLYLKNYKGPSASLAQATSPAINLSAYTCSPKVWITLNFDVSKLDGSNTGTVYKLEFSSNGGTSWTTAWQQTAAQLKASYPGTGYNSSSFAITSGYLTSNFKYRLSGASPAGSSYDSQVYLDDIQIFADACRTTWTNTCADNKDVDYYAKGMKNACVSGTQGWTNIGSADGLVMTNATKVVAYVSMSETGTPAQTVTIRSKNAGGTVLQTVTATLANNEDDPSDINIYEATFTTLTNVASFEASISGSCSTSSSTNPSYIANGLGLAVFRSSVTGNYNTGELKYWGAPGNGTWDYYGSFTLPTTAYTKSVFVTVGVSGITTTPGKDAKIIVSYEDATGTPVDKIVSITNNYPNGDRIVKKVIQVDNVASYSNITVRTDYIANDPNNDVYSVDFIKVAQSCTQPLTLGNLVWVDANGNGIKDGAETGAANVTVNLYQDTNNDNVPDGDIFATTISDASGNYTFSGLTPGNYIVGVVLPPAYIGSTVNGGDPDNNIDNDNNGVATVNGEFRSNSITLSIGGEPVSGVDGDGADGNLTLDFGLLPATLSLTASTSICAATNSNNYTISGLASFANAPTTGSLIISVQGGNSVIFNAPFVSPLAYSISGQIADGATRVVSATFTATSLSSSTSFTAPSAIGSGFYNFPLNSLISDFYWGTSPYPQQGWDNAYVPGLGGPNGLGGGVHDLDLSPSGVTDMAAFCAEMAESADATTHLINKYKVIPLENLNRGRAGEGSTESANIPVGGIGKVRAGMLRYLYDNYYTSTNANSWTSQNGAAFQLAVWEILHESYTSNNAFSVTSSSANGFYVLSTFNTASIAQAQTYLNAINTLNWSNNQWMIYQSVNWHVIALEANNDPSPGTPDGQDFLIAQPIIGVCSLNLGNLVWVDLNANGYKDAGEPPVSGVTVNLYADANGDNVPDGASLATTVTDASGVYGFTNLPAGNYIVGVTLPNGFTNSLTPASGGTTNSDVDNDNNGFTTVGNEVRSVYVTLSVGGEPTGDGDGANGNLTMDFGLKGPLALGNFVWVDLNNNGIYDSGEPTYAGATVKLYADANGDNTPDGAALATTTTDANGLYSFSNLAPGNYIVGVTIPTNYVAGATTATSSNPNNDTNNDNNGVTTVSGELRSNYITLSTGGEPATGVDGDGTNGNLTLDFAIKPTQYVGDYVWLDLNRDGIQDASELGFPGIKVELYNTSNVLQQTTYTNSNGFYYFAVPTGTYYVKFSGLPTGFIFTTQGGGTTSTDSDPNPTTGITANFTITAGVNNTTIDAGLKYTTGVGNFVWADTNGNGQQDAGEPGIPGVFVGLYNSSTNALVGGAISDNVGYYFINTVPGNYYLKINLPAGYNLTTQNAGGVPANLNSDADVSTFKTSNFALTATMDFDWDFGLVLKPNTVVSCGQIPLQTTEITSNITLNKFVPAGYGSLTNVAIDYSALTINPFIGIENTATGAQTFTLTTTSNATLTLPNASTLVVNNGFTTGSTAIATYDGIPDYQGTSGWNLVNNTKANTLTTNPYTPISDFLWTSGGTTVSLPFATANTSNLTMTGGNNQFFISTKSSAGACVTYTYAGLNLGDVVYYDINGNGYQGAGEAGVPSLTVKLYQDANGDNVPDGAAIATTTTNASGVYNFTNLAAGKYIVGVVLPAKYVNTIVTGPNPDNDANSDNNGVTTVSGELRSNFITLSIGGEPLAGIDGDGANGNLTLDFGIVKDTDGDGIPDIIDIDDDNDGITDKNESGGYDPLGDCDGDGTPNYLDPTPGCSTPSGNDPWGKPYLPLTWTDCNSDGINDFFDWDRDGIINELDLDSDNDGILDVQEARPGGVAVTATANGMITGTDADANGLLSSYENGNINPVLNGIAAQDLDKDGTPNFLDLDSDGDGITDATEALGSYDSDGLANGTDTDGDGVRAESFGSNTASTSDNINGFGAKGFTLLDSDGDGKPNAYDIDSDNDGITDNAEAQATCTYKLPTGTDCDGDGVDDSYDATSLCVTCSRTSAGLTPYDKDGDTTPDYLDLDTDNDGAIDIYEGHTIPGTGGHTIPPANYWTGATGDADGDGLIDYFDGFNISSQSTNLWRNVINNNMGTNGAWDTGTGLTGSISQLPESDGLGGCAGGGERDWRTTSILPVTLLEFKGNLNNNTATLNWTVSNEVNMSRYEVEKSSDGVTFVKVSTTNSVGSITTKAYSTTDVISQSSLNIYYRLKMIEKSGVSKYSNVVMFDLRKGKNIVSIRPNPATSNFTVTIQSDKEANCIIKVVDLAGKTLLSKSALLSKGLNVIPFTDLSAFANGVYSVMILTDGNATIEKLLINR